MKDWTDADIDRLRSLAAKGLSAGQIAQKIGRSRNSIIGKCYRSGVALMGLPPGQGFKEKVTAFCIREPGKTPNEVAARVGCSRVYVYKLAVRTGLNVKIRQYATGK